ncbi:MAG: hypothetical protein ACYTGX_13865 [Planctomycetota bacterium]
MQIAGAYYEVGIKSEIELHELAAHYLGAPLEAEREAAGTVAGRLAHITDVVERLAVKDGRYRVIQAHQAWGFLARVYAGDAEAEAQLAASADAAGDHEHPSPVAPLLHAQLHVTRLFDTLQMRPEAGLVLDAPQQALLVKFRAAIEGQLEDDLWKRLQFLKLRPWARAVDRVFAGDPAGAQAALQTAAGEYATRDQAAYLGALHHHARGAFDEAVAAYDVMLERMEAKPAQEGKPGTRAQADRRWPIAFYNRAMARLALPEPDRAAAAKDLRAAAERWAKSSRAHHQALAEKASQAATALAAPSPR